MNMEFVHAITWSSREIDRVTEPYQKPCNSHSHPPPPIRWADMDCVSSFFPTLSNQPLSWWASGKSGLMDVTPLMVVERDLPPKSDTRAPLMATTGKLEPSNSSASVPHSVQETTQPERSTSWISRLFILRFVVFVMMDATSAVLLQTPIISG